MNTLRRFYPALVSCLLLLLALPVYASDRDVVARIDALLTSAYPSSEPGAAVLVARHGQVLLRKGYGMANLELGVPMRPDIVFRFCSITKQFTAAAIMMLAEEGKLSVTDEITRYLPDYPTRGHAITIEHLLTHTSGIRSYTSIPSFRSSMRQDLTVAEMISRFKDEPVDFASGERYLYNNSGYFLLGAVIEKVSGQSYEDFIQARIFGPLQMRDSHYGSESRVIPKRIPGYQRGRNGYENAPYLSMTLPYAAGSLLSSLDDLARWDAALYGDTLLKPSTRQGMFTPYRLKNGRSTNYGYGWIISSYEGHGIVQHGGGINGFSTFLLRMPEERLLVVILSNNTSAGQAPGFLARKVAAEAIGKPVREKVALTLDASLLGVYEGVYRGEEGELRILRDGNRLFLQRGNGPRQELLAETKTEFFMRNSFTTFSFRTDGRLEQLVVRQNDQEETYTRVP